METSTSSSRERIDKPHVARRLGRHPVSVDRYVDQGLLPKPHRFLGRWMWFVDEIVAAEEKLATVTPTRARRQIGGVELAASGRATKKLRAAALVALEKGGTTLITKVLTPFAANGRLDEIPPAKRFEAAEALLAAIAEVRS